jgi:REP element-mobilizing transposase RayT
MTSEAVVLDGQEQRLVAEKLGQAIHERRNRVFAATIQPTHLHIIFGPLFEEVKTIIARLKRRTAVEVLSYRRQRGNRVLPRSLWTEGQFSTSFSTTTTW